MTNTNIIVTDCDGVLLDWETAFYEWMKSLGYNTQKEGVYDMADVFAMEKVEVKKLIREFNNSSWMANLPVLRDARSGVAKLVEAGYEFHCVTSLSLDENTKMLRQQNLDNVFGKDVFTKLVCLDTGADKDEGLEPYKDSGLWWIEDKTVNAECGLKFGMKPILISHNHNIDCDNPAITKCDYWTDVVDTILN